MYISRVLYYIPINQRQNQSFNQNHSFGLKPLTNLCRLTFLSLHLKTFNDGANTTSSGSAFQIAGTRWENEFRTASSLPLGILSLRLFPRVCVFGENVKNSSNSRLTNPFSIRKVKIRSVLILDSSREKMSSSFSLLPYDIDLRPGIRLLYLRNTRSILLISLSKYGE